jgi:hypothetical protein
MVVEPRKTAEHTLAGAVRLVSGEGAQAVAQRVAGSLVALVRLTLDVIEQGLAGC